MTVRPYRPEDAAAVAEVMFRSVREVARDDYSAAQVEAWLPDLPTEEGVARRVADGRRTWVATDAHGAVVGYIDLEADGHIDHLFCAPGAVGRGVGSRLYEAVARAAAEQGLRRLRVEASESARRLFERKGFVLEERRVQERRGVSIHNYAMSKVLGGRDDRGTRP